MEEKQQARKLTRRVQAQALQETVQPRRQSHVDVVLGIVRAAHTAGVRDMSRSEIREAWEALDRVHGGPPRRADGAVSGRVRELLNRQALKQLPAMRACKVTGEMVTVVALISA